MFWAAGQISKESWSLERNLTKLQLCRKVLVQLNEPKDLLDGRGYYYYKYWKITGTVSPIG